MSEQAQCLRTWATLNAHVKKLTESELSWLLQLELAGEARTQFIIRIYGRFNRLRTIRERKELLSR